MRTAGPRHLGTYELNSATRSRTIRFSSRGRPTLSHPLSTQRFVHPTARTTLDLPHRYPRLRATTDAKGEAQRRLSRFAWITVETVAVRGNLVDCDFAGLSAGQPAQLMRSSLIPSAW
jgi:hypothetical protein